MIDVEIISRQATDVNIADSPPAEVYPLQSAVGIKGDPGIGVPPGGTTGQVLAKDSDEDYDTHWVDMSGGGSSAGGIIDSNSGRTIKMWFGSVDEYNALPRKEPDVYYNILEGAANAYI